MLTCSLVKHRLDYCNSLLYGAPVSSINKLQRLLKSYAACVRTQFCQCTDARPLLESLTGCHIQAGISNLQDPQDVISIIPECTPDFCCAQSVAEVVMMTSVTSTWMHYNFCQPDMRSRFQHRTYGTHYLQKS